MCVLLEHMQVSKAFKLTNVIFEFPDSIGFSNFVSAESLNGTVCS